MSDIMKLAIVTTHPIQYNAPWFKLLAARPGIIVKVFYTWEQSNRNEKFDPGFGKVVSWDIPLLDGYDYTFVKNTSANPGSHHYKGIVNPTLNNEIESWGAEAVLVFGWPFKSHLACLRYFKSRIPVLFRGDSTLLGEQGGIKKIMRRLFLRYVYSYIDYALYVGTHNKEYYLAHGLKEKQLVFVPHAVDNDRFVKNYIQYAADAASWRKELGIRQRDFVVLFAGKINRNKNPYFLLSLAEKLKDERLKFVIVGNGELLEDVRNRATDKRVIFIDFQNQSKMPVVYNLADVYVIPSYSETWGLAINEAIASGKPVIATSKAGGAVDLIKNNVNGIVVDPGDINAAAIYVQQLLNGAPHPEKDGINMSILETYSYANIVKNVEALLLTLDRKRK